MSVSNSRAHAANGSSRGSRIKKLNCDTRVTVAYNDEIVWKTFKLLAMDARVFFKKEIMYYVFKLVLVNII